MNYLFSNFLRTKHTPPPSLFPLSLSWKTSAAPILADVRQLVFLSRDSKFAGSIKGASLVLFFSLQRRYPHVLALLRRFQREQQRQPVLLWPTTSRPAVVYVVAAWGEKRLDLWRFFLFFVSFETCPRSCSSPAISQYFFLVPRFVINGYR